MTDWASISVKKTLRKEINAIAEKLKKPFGKTLEIIVKDYGKKRHYEAEIERLNQQLEDYKQQLAAKPAGEPSITNATDAPCFSRYEHNDILLCASLPPPKSAEITTLKRCLHCRKRLTPEKVLAEGLTVKTRAFVTCGAKEHYDKKKGLMLWCPKATQFSGQWITPRDCQTAKCMHIKEVKIS